MRDHRFNFKSHQALIAAKSTVAIVVGYGIGLACDWKASSIAVTIIVLQTATLGTTFQKSALRMVGTLVGAIVGLAIVGVCSHDRELFIAAMALVTAICVWEMQTSNHQYAWMLVMLTCAVVGWPTAMNPLNAFHTCVDRVTAVTVGVLLSGIVHGVFWPVTSGKQFEQQMRDLVAGCHDLASFVRNGLLDQDMDKSALGTMEIKILSLSSSLSTTLTAARADSRRFREHSAKYEQLCNEWSELVLAIAAIGVTATMYRKQLMTVAKSQPAQLHRLLDTLDEACVATAQQLSMSRNGTCRSIDYKSDLRQDTDMASTGRDVMELRNTAVKILWDRIQSFQHRAARVRACLSNVEVAGSAGPAQSTVPKACPAFNERLKKSVLAALQVVTGAGFFILLDWPLGIQSAMILIMIFAYLNAQLPVSLVARTIFKSTLIALPLAAAFHFALMPRLDSFFELAPWLALLFFPMLYGVASRNPLTSMSAMLTVNLVNALISLSTAPPQYDFASFANTYLGMGGGIAVVFLLAYLFETRSPRRGFHGVLTALLSQSADYLEGLKDGVPQSSGEASSYSQHRQHWLQLLEKMKKLSASVDYRQDPLTTRDQVEPVLRTCDALVARLIWHSVLSVDCDAEDEILRKSVNLAHEWCAETLDATAKALEACRPVEIQQPDIALFSAVESRNTGQSKGGNEKAIDRKIATGAMLLYYRSLAEAITDCQRQFNMVDWRRWSQSYF